MSDPMASPNSYNATLLQRLDINPRLAILRVRPDLEVFPFQAGQFTVLGLRRDAPRVAGTDVEDPIPLEKAARLIRRAYSISSGSRYREYLEFYIALIGSGELTPRLFQLQPGDRLFVGSKASGMFTLDRVPSGQGILLVATGTGLAPYLSMVRSEVMSQVCPIRPMAVLHGASYSWDLGYRGELAEMQMRCSNFRYVPVISRPNSDPSWSGRTGRLPPLLTDPGLGADIGMALDPEQTQVFLCGHPVMVEEAMVILGELGYQTGSRAVPGNLHLEKYW